MNPEGQIYFDNPELIPEADRKRFEEATERDEKLRELLVPKRDDLDEKLLRVLDELREEPRRSGAARGPSPTPIPVSERKRKRRDARDARKLNR